MFSVFVMGLTPAKPRLTRVNPTQTMVNRGFLGVNHNELWLTLNWKVVTTLLS